MLPTGFDIKDSYILTLNQYTFNNVYVIAIHFKHFLIKDHQEYYCT